MKYLLNILIAGVLLLASCEDSYREIKPTKPNEPIVDTIKVQPQSWNGYLHLIKFQTFWQGSLTNTIEMKHYSTQIYVRIANNEMASEFTIDNEKEYMICTRSIIPDSYDFSDKPSKIFSLVNNGFDTDSIVYYLNPVPEKPEYLLLPCNQ